MREGDAPGLKRRKRADGKQAFYWVASTISRRAGNYPLKTRRLSDDAAEATAQAQVLTAELREWLDGRDGVRRTFDGTIKSLIDLYKHHDYSPYQKVKGNTRLHYDATLQIIDKAVGGRHVADLTAEDFYRWYDGFLRPIPQGMDEAPADQPPRARRAHNCIKLLRVILSFGKSMKYEGCRDAREILSELAFSPPPPRRTQLSFEQASAIIEHALAIGRPSIALAQALQFELSLRQKDAIGEWFPCEPQQQGIIHAGWRWANGVLWSDLSPDMILRKQTTKTAAVGEWNVRSYPLVMRALEAFPGDRAGPMIVSETSGRPYRSNDYGRKWREIATAVGVPSDVWNMDSRAGGITEGDAAGAEPRDLQRHATHSSFQTTGRYVRGTLASTEKVATLRVASRRKPTGNAP